MVADILGYVGGISLPDAQARAGQALDSACRGYNGVVWRFNLQKQDITLLDNVRDYALNSVFRANQRAILVDSNGQTRYNLEWVPYDVWTLLYPMQIATSALPIIYTIRNEFG